MSEWEQEINDDGEVFIIFDGFFQVYFGDMEDLDKDHFDVMGLITAAPKLLKTLQEACDLLSGVEINSDATNHKQIKRIDEFLSKATEVIANAKNEIPFTDEVVSDETELEW